MYVIMKKEKKIQILNFNWCRGQSKSLHSTGIHLIASKLAFKNLFTLQP